MMLAHIGIVRAMNRLVPEPPFMRARSRRAAGLSEVQEGGKAAPCDIAAAYAALAPAVSGTKRKLKSDFRCYPNNGHAATASAGPFCARKRLMQCNIAARMFAAYRVGLAPTVKRRLSHGARQEQTRSSDPPRRFRLFTICNIDLEDHHRALVCG